MELRKKILAKDFAITHWIPNALMISGACSLEEPQPKFFSGNDDVAGLDLGSQLRAERGKSILFHIVNGL